ncbi:MAG: hypothetical protein DVB28_001423 [Verrucomicrobia bacterium]|nr:MAG: hypothetical protein DVB28_001423 [Verrucomicrobiota bacterium]
MDCHEQKSQKGGLNLTALSIGWFDPSVREHWIRVDSEQPMHQSLLSTTR